MPRTKKSRKAPGKGKNTSNIGVGSTFDTKTKRKDPKKKKRVYRGGKSAAVRLKRDVSLKTATEDTRQSIPAFPNQIIEDVDCGVSDLNLQDAIFVAEYLTDFTGTRAALAAGYSPNSAGLLLKKPAIKAAIAKAVKARILRLGINADSVLAELSKVAFSDPANYYDEDGNVLQLSEIPEEYRGAIKEIRTYYQKADNSKKGLQGGEKTVELKLFNKLAALDTLARYTRIIEGPKAETINYNLQSKSLVVENLSGEELNTLLKLAGADFLEEPEDFSNVIDLVPETENTPRKR